MNDDSRFRFFPYLHLAVTLAVACAAPSFADTLYVDDDAGPGGDGTTWAAAFDDLQDALAAAKTSGSVTEIRIAQGTYKPAGILGDRAVSFELVNGVAARGGYAGVGAPDPDLRDITLFETILCGDLNGDDGPDFDNRDDNSYSVIRADEAGDLIVVDGMTVRGGFANGSSGFNSGAGVFIADATILMSDCTVMECLASSRGGGAYVRDDGAAEFFRCCFSGNQAGSGGAICRLSPAATTIEGCVFLSNTATYEGGAVHFNGAGTLVASQCRFVGNAAGVGGPVGIFTQFDGGAIYMIGSEGVIVNCEFLSNTAGPQPNGEGAEGGAIFACSSAMTISNCSFAANSATHGAGGVAVECGPAEPASIANSILWANTSDQLGTGESAQASAVADINVSCVQGGWTGTGGFMNIATDPLFADVDGADNVPGTADDSLRLASNSPCIDAGFNDIDTDESTTGIQLLGPLDLVGADRFVDTPSIPDTGIGTPPIVDMGAREHHATPSCLGDADGDLIVDLADLLAVIGNWGSDGSGGGDVNGDDSVDLADLLAVIGNWGSAC